MRASREDSHVPRSQSNTCPIVPGRSRPPIAVAVAPHYYTGSLARAAGVAVRVVLFGVQTVYSHRRCAAMTTPLLERAPLAQPPGTTLALEISDLRKTYGKYEAVRGIDITVERGEIFGLLGPNGAGKTTTIEIVTGLRQPTAGRVAIFGIDVAQAPAEARALLGIQLQESDFFEHLTLAEQLRYLGACYGLKPDVQRLLRYVDLGERAGWKLKQLSGGQKQRFALAAALVNDPPLVLLDEPSTGLDPKARRDLWELIRELREDGRTILLSTH